MDQRKTETQVAGAEHPGGKPGISIKINDRHFFAPKSPITGAELKALGGIPPANRLYREEHGKKPDTPIPDGEAVEIHPGDQFYDLPAGTVGLLPGVQDQLERVNADFPGTEAIQRPDGTIRVTVPEVLVSPGWNKIRTRILILLPVGYPQAKPNGFAAEPDLRVNGGQMPGGSGQQTIDGESWLQFCWQPATWEYARDTLWRYVKFCQARFAEVR